MPLLNTINLNQEDAIAYIILQRLEKLIGFCTLAQ